MNSGTLTIKGWKPDGASADYVSTAALNGGWTTPTANGSTLSVSASGKLFRIKDLTIKGGNTTTNGGGINLTGGTLHLRDGAKVTGNKAESGNGGGVYVGTGTTLLMSGTAWVGDGTESRAALNDDGTGFTNKASKGAGIYNDGGIVALGYSLFTIAPSANQQKESLTGGVGRNYATTDGGGIYNASGSLFISTGKISYNTCTTNGGGLYTESSTRAVSITTGTSTVFVQNVAAKGGGLYIAAGKSVNLDGNAVFKCNTATNSGGAIYNEGTLNMSAGTIGGSGLQNTADSAGGAVYNNGTFNFSGVAYIYPGSVTSSTKTNDVYLPEGKYITIDAAYSTSGAQSSTAQMAISPYLYKRGTKILKVASGVTADATLRSRFKLSEDPNNDWNKENKTVTESGVDQTYVILNADVYVAGTGYKTCRQAGTTAAAGANGTKTNPFSTIAEALGVYEDTSSVAVVTIDGEISGGQTVGGTGVTISASQIKLNGYKYTESGVEKSSGILNGGFNATTLGTTLSIDTALLVTLSDLEITGGYSSDNGGGIKIINTNSRVNLNNVAVSGNYAAGIGGGIFISSGGAKVGLYGNTIIGKNRNTPSASNTALSTGINIANAGGGIYNGGYLYLGARITDTGAAVTDSADLTGGVYGNVATTNGGGIYEERTSYIGGTGSAVANGGNVKYNYAASGGGIYVASGKTVNINMASFEQNKAGNYGGAVYLAGTLNLKDRANLYASTNAEKINDIYLPDGKTVQVTGVFDSSITTVATITPDVFNRLREIAYPNGSGVTVDSIKTKFKLSKDDSGWERVTKTVSSNAYLAINSPIYVVGTSDSNSTKPDDTWGWGSSSGNGTKTSPYSSITAALGSADITSVIKITIAGTLKLLRQLPLQVSQAALMSWKLPATRLRAQRQALLQLTEPQQQVLLQ